MTEKQKTQNRITGDLSHEKQPKATFCVPVVKRPVIGLKSQKNGICGGRLNRKLRKKAIPKQKLLARAFKSAEKAMCQAIRRRDKFCQLHGLECKCKVLAPDHFISRTHKATFFDERNMTLVCRDANWQKFLGRGTVAYQIGQIVEKKWGKEAIEDMEIKARFPKKWTIGELQEIEFNYNTMYLD